MLDITSFEIYLDLFATSMEFFILKLFFDVICRPKTTNLFRYLSLVPMIIIIVFVGLLKFNPFYMMNFFVCFILIYSFSCIHYNTKKLHSLLLTIVWYITYVVVNFLSSLLIFKINDLQNINAILDYKLPHIECILSENLLFLLIVIILKILKNRWQNLFQLKLTIKQYLFFVAFFLINLFNIIVVYLFSFTKNNLSRLECIIFISYICVSIFSCSLLFLNLSKVIMYNGILFKNEILNEKLKNYSNILEYNKNFNKFKHDINKHLSCIKNLYSSNIQNHSSADSYIDSLCNSLNKLDIDFDTGNNVLDVILTDKKRTCDKKNITFNPFLMYNIYNFLDDLDICSIFANILDNAIEACDKIDSTDSSSPKKTIFLETKLRFNCLIIRCSNSRINKVRYKTKNILFTDKYNSEHHGYGLESISYSVNKYNGYFEIDTSNDKKYEISVLIPMPYDFVYDTEKIYSN